MNHPTRKALAHTLENLVSIYEQIDCLKEEEATHYYSLSDPESQEYDGEAMADDIESLEAASGHLEEVMGLVANVVSVASLRRRAPNPLKTEQELTASFPAHEARADG